MPENRTVNIPLTWVAVALIPVLTYLGSVISTLWGTAGNVATKGDLSALKIEVFDVFKKTDDAIYKTFEASKRYTDERTQVTGDRVTDHSDSNRKDMELKIQMAVSESRAQQTQLNAMGKQLDNIEGLILQTRKH